MNGDGISLSDALRQTNDIGLRKDLYPDDFVEIVEKDPAPG